MRKFRTIFWRFSFVPKNCAHIRRSTNKPFSKFQCVVKSVQTKWKINLQLRNFFEFRKALHELQCKVPHLQRPCVQHKLFYAKGAPNCLILWIFSANFILFQQAYAHSGKAKKLGHLKIKFQIRVDIHGRTIKNALDNMVEKRWFSFWTWNCISI